MIKARFALVVVLCVEGAIAYGVATGDAGAGWFWLHFGIDLAWGAVGLAVAGLITFPILRRPGLVVALVLGGTPLVAIVGGLPAMGYQDVELARDATRPLAAGDLGRLPAGRRAVGRLSGTWRYDLAAVRTYTRTEGTNVQGRCDVYTLHACRVPVVSDRWTAGDPVLAISSACTGPGKPVHRMDVPVELAPATGPESGHDEFARADRADPDALHGTCANAPPEGHARLAPAAVHFDEANGFLVLPRPDAFYHALSVYIIEGLFALAALVFALRPSYRRARVPRRRELPAPAEP